MASVFRLLTMAPSEMQARSLSSLGSERILRGLLKQMNGTMTVGSSGGTRVEILSAKGRDMIAEKTVLVVEDEFLIANLLSEMVADVGMTVCGVADNVDLAIEMAAQHRPDVVLMDVRLKGKRDGVDAAIAIYHQNGTPAVFITGSREPANIARIKADHPAAILIKPISFEELSDTLEKICA